MDPDACLLALASCLADGEQELAYDCLENYATWRQGGGFAPANGDARFRSLLDWYVAKFGPYDGPQVAARGWDHV